MQAIAEILFDVVYLVSVVTIGILMIKKCRGNMQYKLFGIMAVTLGVGDSFHLVPRAIALCTTGLDNYTVPLGVGKAYYFYHNDSFLYFALLCLAFTLSYRRKAEVDMGCLFTGGGKSNSLSVSTK